MRKINDRQIEANAAELRKKLGEDSESPIDIFALISNVDDITLMFYPMSDGISGICIKDNGNKIIGVNTSFSYGRQRFTVAHELCHLFYHEGESCYVCNIKGKNSDAREKEADLFASYFLAPFNSFRKFVTDLIDKETGKISMEGIIRCEQYFGLSHIATLIRLKKDMFITQDELDRYSENSPAMEARTLGYSTDLYAPTKKKSTIGKYIKLTNKLYNNDIISTGKYEELLMDAFREDIVFGDGGENGVD